MIAATEQTLCRALACAAVHRGLRSILVFDAPPLRLQSIARYLAQLIDLATGRAAETRTISASAHDDHLWGAYRVGPVREPVWSPGLLSPRAPTPGVFVTTNLATVGLDVARALVTLVGADVAHVERHGRSETWAADDTWWLAACDRADVGKISPHLIDRFAVRIQDGAAARGLDAASLEALVSAASASGRTEDAPKIVPLSALPDGQVLRAAAARDVAMSPEALDRVAHHLGAGPGTGMRRQIALARLAAGEARLDAASVVVAAHVDAAARLMGLAASAPPAPAPRPKPPPQESASEPLAPSSDPSAAPAGVGQRAAAPVDDTLQPPVSGSVVPLEPIVVTAADATPHPEDNAPVQREVTPLALPMFERRAAVRATRGNIVGVKQAHDLSDIALTATILEAAKYQAVRPRRDGLVVWPSDLRGYRRVAPLERMLVVVLDYTCLDGWDWTSPLVLHLREAYAARASICMVQVGAASAASELRAEHVVARNLLAAPLDEFLEARPGRATPLAHGLELAFEALRHALHHGREIAVKTRLVVITDARGNVPLEASLRGELTSPVRSEGVRDALTSAEKIRGLDRLEAIVIQPPPDVCVALPAQLAAAMGATLHVPRDPEELEV